jgi:hypothetical protein
MSEETRGANYQRDRACQLPSGVERIGVTCFNLYRPPRRSAVKLLKRD